MKLTLVLLMTVLCAAAHSDHLEKWSAFKSKHGKFYKNVVEEKLRYRIFQENLRKIEEHNIKYENGEVGYFMGVNKFTDQTPEEFRSMLMIQKMNKPVNTTTNFKFPKNVSLSQTVDWREKGAVLDVKDQGSCSASYAFSAIGALEGQNFIVNSVSTSLSEQQIIDCSDEYYNYGCQAGDIRYSFHYVQDHGIVSEADYPYKGNKQQSCNVDVSKVVIKTLYRYNSVQQLNENALLHAVDVIGPISISMNFDLLQSYAGGIFDDYGCLNGEDDINHGVLVVGYDLTSETPYWIIKNSFGTDWGEKGYLRLKEGLNICGITWAANFPILK